MISLDTNILVYAVDDRDRDKQQVARTVVGRLGGGDCAIALQVIGELQNALRRRLGMPAHMAMQQARNIFTAFPSFGYDAACVETALAQAAAGRFGYWDALLVSACARAGVTTLISEDMTDGAAFAGVHVINPFAATGPSPAVRDLLNL